MQKEQDKYYKEIYKKVSMIINPKRETGLFSDAIYSVLSEALKEKEKEMIEFTIEFIKQGYMNPNFDNIYKTYLKTKGK